MVCCELSGAYRHCWQARHSTAGTTESGLEVALWLASDYRVVQMLAQTKLSLLHSCGQGGLQQAEWLAGGGRREQQARDKWLRRAGSCQMIEQSSALAQTSVYAAMWRSWLHWDELPRILH